ncbi:MAG: hypothetical protein VX589_15490 [Myxococcota bacterium]|nr:hypothetical protein [Myxococcota bacterium]
MAKRRKAQSKKSSSRPVPKRRAEVEELKAWKDQRWKKLAKADLEELAEKEAGAQLLADAIRAILRQNKVK